MQLVWSDVWRQQFSTRALRSGITGLQKAIIGYLTLGTAAYTAWGGDPDISNVSIIPNLPGAIYVHGDQISFAVTLPDSKKARELTRTVTLAIANVDGVSVESFPALELTPRNEYTAKVKPHTSGLGYYTVTASMGETSKSKASQSSLSFGIIPNVGLKHPVAASPFGVVTHFMRWRRDELPSLQTRLGISWFREEMDFRRCADRNQVSPLFTLAEKYHLTWLPLIDYVDANRGKEVDGVWRWDADIAKLKRAFEIHKGGLRVYESQNEPNNFGNWTKRFKGPAEPWLADNWGKPFCDLAKAMKQTLNAADPRAKLLWPDLDSPAWINAFASKWDAAPFIDGVAPHPYSLHGQLPEEQEYVRGAKNYLELLDANHIPRNIWITELGYTTYKNPSYRKGDVAYHPLNEQQQASWLVRAYLSHLGSGVSRIFWYDLMEDGDDENNCEHRFGLLRHGSLTPKPAAIAYANLIHEAMGCKWIAPCKLAGSPTAIAYAFASSLTGTPVLAAWVSHGTSQIRFSIPVQVTDLFGGALKTSDGMVTLTESPVYIHGLTSGDLDLGERVRLAADEEAVGK